MFEDIILYLGFFLISFSIGVFICKSLIKEEELFPEEFDIRKTWWLNE